MFCGCTCHQKGDALSKVNWKPPKLAFILVMNICMNLMLKELFVTCIQCQ